MPAFSHSKPNQQRVNKSTKTPYWLALGLLLGLNTAWLLTSYPTNPSTALHANQANAIGAANQLLHAKQTEFSTQKADQITFGQNNRFDQPVTPLGILSTNQEAGTIQLTSYYGHLVWTHNIHQSRLARIAANNGRPFTLQEFHVWYAPEVNRIIVYGTLHNTRQERWFLYQITVDNGRDWFLLNNDNTPNPGDSLFTQVRVEPLRSLGAIVVNADGSVVLLPKNANASVNVPIIVGNLNTYVMTLQQLDVTNLNIAEDIATPVTPTEQDRADNQISEQTTSTKTSYQLGGILTFANSTSTSDERILILAAQEMVETSTTITITSMNQDGTTSTSSQTSSEQTTRVGLLQIFLDQQNNYSKHVFTPLWANEQTQTEDNTAFANAIFLTKTVHLQDGFHTYFLQKPTTEQTDGNQLLIKLDQNNQTTVFQLPKEWVGLDLIVNYNNQKAYLWAANSTNNQLALLLLNDLKGDQPTNDNSNTLTFANSILPITETSNLTANALAFVIDRTYYATNNQSFVNQNGLPLVISNEVNNTHTGYHWLINKSAESNVQLKKLVDITPTQLNQHRLTAQLLATNPNLLPSQVNLQLLNQFLFLVHKNDADSNDRLFNSMVRQIIGAPQVDDVNGQWTGNIRLGLTKWWYANQMVNNNRNIDNFVINLRIQNLTQNAQIMITLVQNSTIDPDKFAKIQALAKTRYPSQVTKSEYLNDFFILGANVTISEDNIVLLDQTITPNFGAFDATTLVQIMYNDQTGIINVAYNLNGMQIASQGNGQFINFLSLNVFTPIQFNNRLLNNLKANKLPIQVTKEDLIDTLVLPQVVDKNPANWEWKPTVDLTSDKQATILMNLTGRLSGTLTYNRNAANAPSSIPDRFFTININPIGNGNGFLTLFDFIGQTSAISLQYHPEIANQTSVFLPPDAVARNLNSIIQNSFSFFNNWTSTEFLTVTETALVGDQFTFQLALQEQVPTNIMLADQSFLVLDADWITTINDFNQGLVFNQTFQFTISQVNYQWNYAINQAATTVAINELSGDIWQNLMGSLPTTIKADLQKNSFLDFQTATNLLDLSNNNDPSQLNYFEIENIELLADDEQGHLTVVYQLFFPNLSDPNDENGKVVATPSLTLQGFHTQQAANLQSDVTRNIAIGVTLGALGLFLLTFFIYRILFVKNKQLNSQLGFTNNQEAKNYNSMQTHFLFSKKINRIRNTKHGTTNFHNFHSYRMFVNKNKKLKKINR